MGDLLATPWLLAVAGGALILGIVIAYGVYQSAHASRAQAAAGERGARRMYGKDTETPSATATRPIKPVRPAARKEEECPSEQWDDVDEASDESFPASDPPARY